MDYLVAEIVESTPLQLAVLTGFAFFLDLLIRRIVRRAVKRMITKAEARRDENQPSAETTDQLAILRSSERTAQRAQAIGSLFTGVTTLLIWVGAVVLALQIMGFDLLPLIASAGFIGAAISFGAQKTIADVLSGVSIILEDEFGVGDFVDLGPAIGNVISIGLRTTRLRDASGVIWHVRNGEVTRVANRSQGWMLAVVDVPVAVNSDLSKVRDAVEAVSARISVDTQVSNYLLGRVAYAGVESISAEAIIVRITAKTVPDGTASVTRAIREDMTKSLAKRGIVLASAAVMDSNPSPA
jgi:small conductance mechanosensitive channel